MPDIRVFSPVDIVNAYEHTHSITQKVFAALRQCRKYGFRMCQYTGISDNEREHYAAIFCLSICHEDTILSKVDVGCSDFKSSVKEAINKSSKLKKDVEFLLSYSPFIEWNGGG